MNISNAALTRDRSRVRKSSIGLPSLTTLEEITSISPYMYSSIYSCESHDTKLRPGLCAAMPFRQARSRPTAALSLLQGVADLQRNSLLNLRKDALFETTLAGDCSTKLLVVRISKQPQAAD